MPLIPGARLGPYEVGPLLGAGGMGEVYRAYDPRLGRDVAIKVLRGDSFADPDRLRRFEQEARAAAALNHPNILVVHDVGTDDGQPFVVSELLEGETLRAKIERGPLPVRKALDYAIQIAQGLAAGHAKGLIHRDVKPANLFVTSEGRLKILDFGLAKLIGADPAPMGGPAADRGTAATTTTTTTNTRAGDIVGTAAYMSPEQIRCEDLDARSDIFSFGSVLHEMLSGKRPFARSTAIESMNATLKEEPPDLAETTDLPPGLLVTLQRCLEKDREDRFQSAADLAFDLAQLRSGVVSHVHAGLSRPRRWRPGVYPVAMVLAAVLAVVTAFMAGTRAGRVPLPVFEQLTFRRGDVLSARFTPDGYTVVYGAAWDGKPIQLATTRLDTTESRPLGLADGDILAISPSGEMAISLGRRYAVGWAARGTLARLPLDGASPRQVLGDVEAADWSPDGRSLAVVSVVGGKYRIEFPIGSLLYETAGWISHVRVSPDGSRVAFADHPVYGDDRGAVCVIPRSGGAKHTLSGGWSSVTGVAWSRDGKEVWFTAAEVGATASLRAVDESGRVRLVLPAAGRLAIQDIDANGRVLLTESKFRLRIGTSDPRGGGERDVSWLDGSVANDLSADASTILFTEQAAGSATSAYAVYVRGTNGAPPTRIGEGSVPSLSPDGKWAAAIVPASAPSVVLLPTSIGESRTLERGSLVDYEAVAWFPDGRRVLLAAREAGRRVRLWDQDVAGGAPRPVSAEGLRIEFSSRPISPNGRDAAALDEHGGVWLQPLDGGAPERLAGLDPGDIPIRWDAAGASLYVYRKGELPSAVQRYRLGDHLKQAIASLAPADRGGVSGLVSVQTTPDGQLFFYTYSQMLSDLFLVSNLR